MKILKALRKFECALEEMNETVLSALVDLGKLNGSNEARTFFSGEVRSLH
jgi:hypothetical protein